jgi:hypothetical protein
MADIRIGRDKARKAVKSLTRAGFLALPRGSQREIMHLLGRPSPWEPGVVLPPPPCPDGMVTAPPDFVGVGVQKAGTSWWYSLLCEHDGVHRQPGATKERHFFMRFFQEDMGPEGVGEYARWFARPPGLLTGEWTPDYMASFWVAPLLRIAAPNTKILVLLRDPVDRWVSGLTHRKRLEPVLDWRGGEEAFSRGRYFEQLAWLTEYFQKDQLLVLQYEKCRLEPSVQLSRTLKFLGLPDPHTQPGFDRAVNRTEEPKVALRPHVRRELVRRYTPEVTALVEAYEDIDIALWPNFAHLI